MDMSWMHRSLASGIRTKSNINIVNVYGCTGDDVDIGDSFGSLIATDGIFNFICSPYSSV